MNTTMAVLGKIVSGGQTGVDRGALDAAIAAGIEHGGWCPAGRRAEDGTIPACYALRETESPEYTVRTEQNVLDSDGTLILCRGEPTGGTELTLRLAKLHGQPHLVVDVSEKFDIVGVADWLHIHGISVLNVAGPRESQLPGMADAARRLVGELIARLP